MSNYLLLMQLKTSVIASVCALLDLYLIDSIKITSESNFFMFFC